MAGLRRRGKAEAAADDAGPSRCAPQRGGEGRGERREAALRRIRRLGAAYLQACFGLDARSLACFRAALSLAVLYDVFVDFLPWCEEFLGDGPVALLPREDLPADGPVLPSLYLAASGGGPQGASWPRFLLLAEAASAAALAAGLHCQIAAPCLFALHHSLVARCDGLIHGGDMLALLYLFIACFLPLDGTWALTRRAGCGQARGGGAQAGAGPHVSAATVCLCLVWSQVYFLNGLSKLAGPLWQEGSALGQILTSNLSLTSELGAWVGSTLPVPLLQLGTWAAVCLQLTLPTCSILVPWQPLRCVAACVVAGIHLSFFLLFNLGNFAFVGVAGALALIPGSAWARLDGVLPLTRSGGETPSRPVVPGVGHLCIVLILASASVGACVLGYAAWEMAAAVAAVLCGSAWLCVQAALALKEPPADAAPGGRAGASGCERALLRSARGAAAVSSDVLLVFVCAAAVLGNTSSRPLDANALRLSEPLTLRLPVGLFSGNGGDPFTASQWILAVGTRHDQPTELLDWWPFGAGATPRPLSLEQPHCVSCCYPNTRWEKAVACRGVRPQRLAAWLCRRFAGQGLSGLQLVQLARPFPGAALTGELLSSRACSADPHGRSLDVDWLAQDGLATWPVDPGVPDGRLQEMRRLLVRGMRVRLRDGFLPWTNSQPHLAAGDKGEFVNIRDGALPAYVRWERTDSWVWVPLESLELLDGQPRAQELARLQARVHSYQQGTPRVGERIWVRMLRPFESVHTGMVGHVLGTNGGQPPVQVSWTEKDGGAGVGNFTYWVHWSDIEEA